MNSKSIVFFGSGNISLATLKALADKFPLEAIITRPDTNLRGKVITTPIKDWAGRQGLPLFQPADKQELAKLFSTQKFRAQAGVVAEYGIIIPKPVIDYFPAGVINCHFSLLPRWRGADPIRAAILHGDTVSGVSLFRITPGLDDGNIIAQVKIALSPSITAPKLTQRLVKLNDQLLAEALPAYLEGRIQPRPQDQTIEATYAPRITKEAGQIDWAKPAEQIERQVRAYLGWPGSYTKLGGKDISLLKARLAGEDPDKPIEPGEIIPDPRHLLVQTGQGALEIVELKPAGKRPMSGSDFIRGYLRS